MRCNTRESPWLDDPHNKSCLRIIYHQRTSGIGAQGVHIRSIIKALRERGHVLKDVSIVRLTPSGTPVDKAALSHRRGVVFRRVWLRNLLELGYNVVGIPRILCEGCRFRPDLIYERYAPFMLTGVVSSRLLGVPLLLEVNSAFAQAEPRLFIPWLWPVARAVERCVFAMADAVITVSGTLARTLSEMGVPPDKIHATHNGVDPDLFHPSTQTRSRARLALGVDDAFVIGYSGYILSVAQPLLATVEGVSRRIQDAVFLVIGGGPETESFKEELARRGLSEAVRFVGRVQHHDMPFYLSALDVGIDFAHPDWESPVKLFEYMGMGLPVVVEYTPAVAEIVRHSEVGLVVTPGDVQSLSDALTGLRNDPHRRHCLGRAARAKVLAAHTWTRNADCIVDIHRAIVSGYPRFAA